MSARDEYTGKLVNIDCIYLRSSLLPPPPLFHYKISAYFFRVCLSCKQGKHVHNLQFVYTLRSEEGFLCFSTLRSENCRSRFRKREEIPNFFFFKRWLRLNKKSHGKLFSLYIITFSNSFFSRPRSHHLV